jgi:anthranilate synthase component II
MLHSSNTEKLLILDNYDSFTYNLVHLVEKVSDVAFDVYRNDKIKIDDIHAYSRILLSPGPGLPKDAGIMPELLKKYSSEKSILGICLGMQAIGETFGSKLKNLETVYHGLATPIEIISDDILFKECPKQFTVGRYHSWVLDTHNLPNDLIVTARDDKNNIMAVKHKHLDVRGVQFHPESVLSEFGGQIIGSWLTSNK